MISVNNFKTDSKNDNEKGMPSIPSPEPMTSYIDDLDFFKDFEKEFPAIVYNNAQTSKSDLLTDPTLNSQHIDKLNLNDETSLSEYDEEEQNILYFNDLFPFNVIHPNDLKSDEDNDNNEIDIIQSSEDMAPLPPREQRHPFLRYQGLEYTDEDIADFEERLEKIYGYEIHRVQVVDFQGMPKLMRDGLFTRMRMEHRDDASVVVFTSQAWGRLFATRGPLLGGARRRLSWRQYILALGLHTGEEMESPSFARAGCWIGQHPLLVSQISEEILGGLTVIIPESPIIDIAELAPQQPPPPPPTAAARTIPQRLGRLEADVQGLCRDVGSLCGLVERSMTDQGRFPTWMISCMAQLMDASGLPYQAFDGTFQRSSPLAFQRRTRQRTNGASTSTTQQDLQEPDL
ncbi:hypothetical protein Tco_0596155 [Tanacetum coccineum]